MHAGNWYENDDGDGETILLYLFHSFNGWNRMNIHQFEHDPIIWLCVCDRNKNRVEQSLYEKV